MDYQLPEYKRSRGAYMVESSVQYLVTLLVTDTFLAKLLTNIGISDSLTGVISSFVSLAFLVQLLSIFLVKVRLSSKTIVILFDTISMFFFMLLYLVPFFPIDKQAKSILIMVSIIVAYAANCLILPISFQWANSYVDPTRRARYSASKEILSLLSGMVFSVVMGYVIDRYEGLGNLNGGFLFLAMSILVLNICNFICYLMIKKDTEKTIEEKQEPFSAVWKHTVGNKEFRNVIFLGILLNVASGFTMGFIGVFKLNDLLISVFAVQIINVAANLVRMCISKPFGAYSDKHSFVKGYKLGLYLVAGSYLAAVFTTKNTWFLIVVHTVLYSCSMAGTNQNSYNITYSYVDNRYITQATAIKYSIGGVCGFAASILAGKILSFIQGSGNQLFGITMYGQQLLAAISFLVILAAIFFTGKVIEKK